MPYLIKELRYELDNIGELDVLRRYLSSLDFKHFIGALNYIVFSIVREWFSLQTRELSYFELASIIGTIDCSKEEIRRRILNPYEDKKMKDNGDVF